jgi:hypothetical protein
VLQDHPVQLYSAWVFPLRRTARPPQRPVPRDRRQPSGKSLRVIQLRKRLERQEQGVLGHIFRRVSHYAACYRYHRSPVATDQLIKGGHLSEGCCHCQFRVGILEPGGRLHRFPRAPAAGLPPSLRVTYHDACCTARDSGTERFLSDNRRNSGVAFVH